MLNRLLTRKGRRVGALVSAGQEDSLQMERGIQTYLGFSYADRLHIATHHHNDPLIPRERVHGVRGRIDLFGNEVLPLREADAREAVNALLDEEVEGIVVCLLFSYRNPAHEQLVREIVEEEKARRGVNGACPVFVSSELYPSRRDFPRLNTTVIEAYAAEPSRGTLRAVRDRTKERGAAFELRVMASHGGTISIDADQLATHPRLRADRRRRRRPLARRPDRPRQRALHRHRRHLLRHRPAHRAPLRGDDDARHGEIPAQHAAGADRLGRRRRAAPSSASTPTRAGPRSAPTRPGR